MNTEHTLHYESAAEAQTAARILVRQSSMVRVTVLPAGTSLNVSYDTPLFKLLCSVLRNLHAVAQCCRRPVVQHRQTARA